MKTNSFAVSAYFAIVRPSVRLCWHFSLILSNRGLATLTTIRNIYRPVSQRQVIHTYIYTYKYICALFFSSFISSFCPYVLPVDYYMRPWRKLFAVKFLFANEKKKEKEKKIEWAVIGLTLHIECSGRNGWFVWVKSEVECVGLPLMLWGVLVLSARSLDLAWWFWFASVSM